MNRSRVALSIWLLCLNGPACSLDDRAVGINERDGVPGAGSGGSGGNGGGGGGSGNSSTEPLDAGTGAGGSLAQATPDAAGPAPACGAEGEACCATAPRCDL